MRHSLPYAAFTGFSVALTVALAFPLALAITGCASRPDVRADDGIGAVIAETDTGSRRPLPKPKSSARRKKAKAAGTASGESAAGNESDASLGILADSSTALSIPKMPRGRSPLPRYTGGDFYSPVVTRAEGEHLREQIVFEALAQIGRPYIYGGADSDGFDCSGLVKTVFARSGVQLPRTAQQQCAAGTPVDSLDEARPGDLLCFDTHNEGRVSHVVLYTGQNMGVHAPHTNKTIVAVPINTGYWTDHLVGISRVLR